MSATTRAVAPDGYTDWPEFHGGPQLTGVSADPDVTAESAAGWGVRWSTYSTGPVLASPVVAYSPGLGLTLVYAVNDNGDVEAMDLATGRIVWSVQTGVPLVATPLVSDGAVWVATELSPELEKLDADTGALECAAHLTGKLLSSPAAGPGPGGVPSLFEGQLDTAKHPGSLVAVRADTCAVESTTPSRAGGPWNPIAYADDANGRPLALMGTSDPDNAVYAVDARTGAVAWRVAPPPTTADDDMGAGVTVSAPGVNGFADGVAYIPGKNGLLYAIDLTTGQQLWTFDFAAYLGGGRIISRSTAALTGTTLVFGTLTGTLALDVVTRQVAWFSAEPDGAEVLSSPAVLGPPGDQVVVTADLGGSVRVLSAATGAALFATTLGGYITASPADSDGNVVLASSDGYVYDLGAGGAGGAAGVVATSQPQPGQTVPNPLGPVTVTGSASDPAGVAAVSVAVQLDGSAGRWWDADTGTWVDGPYYDDAQLTDPGGTATGWSLAVPTQAAGGTLQVTAVERSSAGPAGPDPAQLSFTVAPATASATLTLSSTVASPGQAVGFTGSGFAPGAAVAVALGTGAPLTVPASAQGTIGGSVRVPSGASAYGATVLTATSTQSGFASARLDVTDSWTEDSQDAGHTGLQPGDGALALASPRARYTLAERWTDALPAAVATSPTVYDNVVYTADAAGEVTAVALQTGARLWTASLGAAATSAPDYDHGRILVAAGASLWALDAATGSTDWTAPLPGPVAGAVTVTGGAAYVVTDDGQALAISEVDGAVSWQRGVPAQVRSPAAVDPAAGLLVTGSDDGSLTALSLSSGTPRWQRQLDGAVTVSPTVAAGTVYVGTGAGREYALAEATGALRWQSALPGADTTTAALTPNDLVVGDAAGSLVALVPGTGREVAHVQLRGAPVLVGGVAATPDRILVATTDGKVELFRSPSDWITHNEIFIIQTAAGLAAGPVVVNNEVLVAGEDAQVRCFTPAGSVPLGG